ncbi:hypothetical protein [Neptuniibacter sp. QD37_11]|uniref:hypothetical protein n=1 Tax=Neptuniibacter sp. QD37_11 TaxID=3398209 RepID=UPI0039F625A4
MTFDSLTLSASLTVNGEAVMVIPPYHQENSFALDEDLSHLKYPMSSFENWADATLYLQAIRLSFVISEFDKVMSYKDPNHRNFTLSQCVPYIMDHLRSKIGIEPLAHQNLKLLAACKLFLPLSEEQCEEIDELCYEHSPEELESSFQRISMEPNNQISALKGILLLHIAQRRTYWDEAEVNMVALMYLRKHLDFSSQEVAMIDALFSQLSESAKINAWKERKEENSKVKGWQKRTPRENFTKASGRARKN